MMETKNIVFTDFEDLEDFIEESSLRNKESLLIQIFSGVLEPDKIQKISSFLLKKLPQAKIIGSTTDGEIFEDKVLTESIIISISSFEKTKIKIAGFEVEDISHSYESGLRIADELLENDSKVFILFGDGLNVNGEDFLNGVNEIAKNVVVAGGLAGDNATFTMTYLFVQDRIIYNGVVGVSLNSKELNIFNSYSFAWEEIGREFVVEKSKKNIVYQIDGITPYELYKKYLGDDIAKKLPSIGIEFPLIITDDKNLKKARAVLAKNNDGSLIFAGNINEGSKVKFGIGNSDVILKDSQNLTKVLARSNVEGMFIYSCMARRRFLESQANIDVKYFSKIANVSGFFTYGEFFTNNNRFNLLNETLTILALSENKINKDIKIDFDNTIFNQATTLQALSHLANIASKEFEELNDNLELKIKEEVKKNIEFERRLFNSMKMASLGDMIANIAHQWRQPLTVITSTASAIELNKQLGILDDESLSEYIQSIISQANYLSETIDTFRNFIKEKQELKTISIQQEIKKALKITEATFKDNSIELIDNINWDEPIEVELIAGELSQVIINIINNARDAMKEKNIEKKRIKLNLYEKNGKVIIEIEDNGGGIPGDILPRIFEPYFTTKDESHGTGIGLYMSYDIIVKHFNGELKAVNVKDGAKFIIEIPMANKS